jgi:class 3 adenylate cyclase/ligand-binding sensor domain-containing protein
MQKLYVLLFFLLFYVTALAQPSQAQIKTYAVEDGRSHQTFKIQQDAAGYIWLATLNGLKRFDGINFWVFNQDEKERYLPLQRATDLWLSPDGALAVASQDQALLFDPATGAYRHILSEQAPDEEENGPAENNNIFFDNQGWVWVVSRDERSSINTFRAFDNAGKLKTEIKLRGPKERLPLWHWDDDIFLGQPEALYRYNRNGELQEQYPLPKPTRRVAQLQGFDHQLYLLCSDGSLYGFNPGNGTFTLHPASVAAKDATAFLAEPNGDVWIGGRDLLQYYNSRNQNKVNYHNRVLDAAKIGLVYRQIFRDRSGSVWVASDHGAIKLVQSSRLFSNYLHGGNEYCINLLCSTRGMAEDEQGQVYISYYNSIHVLDEANDALRPLFPTHAFSNHPFGLAYYDRALWTGNGRRIDLRHLRVDTLFNHPAKDMGAVAISHDSLVWMGYLSWLYQYDPRRRKLSEFADQRGKWAAEDGTISFLYQGRHQDLMWVGTMENGVFAISKANGRQAHFHAGMGSSPLLESNQVNAIYETPVGILWLGTAEGLHRLQLGADTVALTVFTTAHGLPNNFINSILAEGDSCLWISTDRGLSRFSLANETFSNFFVEDGISSNEFNRIAALRSSSGRLYFGGLNGVNAFFPAQFLKKQEDLPEAPILFTGFSKFDGALDSTVWRAMGLSIAETVVISPNDRDFTFHFALADYRNPHNNVFSYKLEGYDDWSSPSTNRLAKYNNIPPGNYILRVRAKAGGSSPYWNSQELAIRIVVQEAFYRTWWFWGLCALLLGGGTLGFMRYRIYLARKREQALEELVSERTRELEEEKHKSEELLLNILPAEIAEELKTHGRAKAKRHEFATVMFSDFKGFSRISEQMTPEELVAEIDCCFRAFDEIMEQYGLEKIKTVGDAYLCVGGMRNDHDHEAERVILAAMDIQAFMAQLAAQRRRDSQLFFEARIGIHTGPLVAGIVGIKKFAYDIWGDTVNLASRMESYGEAGRVNISEATYRLVQPNFRCTLHGQFTETGGGDIDMYFVEAYQGDPALLRRTPHGAGI